jgi:hypothetical protein
MFRKCGKVQIVGRNHNRKSCIDVEVTGRMSCGNAPCLSVYSIVSGGLLFINKDIKIYTTVPLADVLRGCEFYCITLEENIS